MYTSSFSAGQRQGNGGLDRPRLSPRGLQVSSLGAGVGFLEGPFLRVALTEEKIATCRWEVPEAPLEENPAVEILDRVLPTPRHGVGGA